jgi:hypothetical protein
MTDEDLIDEMLWIAFKEGVGIELAEAAGHYIQSEKLTRKQAYDKAFQKLDLKL